MNQTPNYALSQWSKDDRILMDDFNADNAKIDEALAAQAGTLAEHTETLAGLGSARVHIGSYVGTGQCGQEHPTSYTFPAIPACFFIMRANGLYTMIGRGGAPNAATVNSGNMSLTWDGTTVSWYGVSSNGQYNVDGSVYYVIAFYES